MFTNFIPEEPQYSQARSSGLVSLDRIAVIVLGGGEGKRLHPLTKSRCKPAISFGGRYTLIDIPISHSLITGLRKIYVIGQYMASSLHRHLAKTYPFLMQKDLHLLVPEERRGERIWYEGTADAVRKNLDFFAGISADYFLILSGDQLYNINFQKMINFGIEKDASMVIAAQPVTEKDAMRMGLLQLKPGSTEMIDFCEKPKEKGMLDHFAHENYASDKRHLGSMGIYFFKREALFDLLLEDPRADFGMHLITTEMRRGSVHSYIYDGYWEDIGTIDSYYHANLALTKQKNTCAFNCYDESNLIMTQSYHLPGAKLSNCMTNESVLCEGALIEAEAVTNSIIGVRSKLAKGVVVQDSILMGNSYYEQSKHMPAIGENSFISRAIIDENVVIGKNVKLINREGHHTYDDPEGHLFVRDGIIVIPAKATLPDNFVF